MSASHADIFFLPEAKKLNHIKKCNLIRFIVKCLWFVSIYFLTHFSIITSPFFVLITTKINPELNSDISK